MIRAVLDPTKNYDVVIIPDRHIWSKSIKTIPNYLQEIERINQEIYTCIRECENPVAIHAGDLYHQSIPSLDLAERYSAYPKTMHLLTDKRNYSVVGNHEITYNRNNPFWNLSSLNSDFILKKSHSVTDETNLTSSELLKLKKDSPIKIYDELRIGKTLFVFGHYSALFTQDLDLTDIEEVYVISHNAILEDEITEALIENGMQNNVQYLHAKNIFNSGILPDTVKLKGVFVGHMHSAHGKFQIEEDNKNFFIQYMGSLARTQVGEFTENNTRELPILRIRDGRVQHIDYYTINLAAKHLSIDKSLVEANREKREAVKKHDEICEVSVTAEDNLLDTIKAHLSETASQELEMLISIQENILPADLMQLLERFGA